MDEQLKAMLNQFGIDMLSKVQSGIDIGTKFLGEQLPLVAQEIIKWGIARSIFYTSMCLILTIVFAVVGFLLYKAGAERAFDDSESNVAAIVFGIIFIVVAGIFFLCSFYHVFFIVKIVVAPRVYLIQELTKIISSGGFSGL